MFRVERCNTCSDSSRLALVSSFAGAYAQAPNPRPTFDAFEVATIKPVVADAKASRFITMQGANRFVVKDYSLKLLIAAAFVIASRRLLNGVSETDTCELTMK